MATDTEPKAAVRAPAPARGPRAGTGNTPGVFGTLSHLALLVWAILIIGPILWTFLASFKTNTEIFGDPITLPASFGWDAWGWAWEKARIGRYMLNTVFVVACSTAGTMLLGSMAAYVLARYSFPGNRAIYLLFVSGMTFPVFLALVPLFLVVRNLGLIDTHLGVILVYIAYSLPFTVFFLTAFFRTLPTSVAEAAMMDGCSHTRTFFQVMMPMAKPGLISITIFNVLGQWNQYLLPLVLLTGNVEDRWLITQGIANISVSAGHEANWPGLFAALSMAIVPVMIVYIVFQRQIQSGLTSGAVK
ncbi:N-acetylglucosamine transport system permease protein [Streptosporangium becharense]|uniref:N-acetylglucosamine transport system permease protein n=1 Tax=Streptosporangium becharense TaxID=1816182 RepID=A0A7W9IJB0_9ACTN|nr:carbohydrate ABC transporter permease [Streptosporangium becharense]MBB2911175.1 N-acetylglucosamine transport system permease protein [Streptosporangium becharense]MBB5821767.1 N-acetylglucosamine transport system permease protein [Streptosporangium becharense]